MFQNQIVEGLWQNYPLFDKPVIVDLQRELDMYGGGLWIEYELRKKGHFKEIWKCSVYKSLRYLADIYQKFERCIYCEIEKLKSIIS